MYAKCVYNNQWTKVRHAAAAPILRLLDRTTISALQRGIAGEGHFEGVGLTICVCVCVVWRGGSRDDQSQYNISLL